MKTVGCNQVVYYQAVNYMAYPSKSFFVFFFVSISACVCQRPSWTRWQQMFNLIAHAGEKKWPPKMENCVIIMIQTVIDICLSNCLLSQNRWYYLFYEFGRFSEVSVMYSGLQPFRRQMEHILTDISHQVKNLKRNKPVIGHGRFGFIFGVGCNQCRCLPKAELNT